MTMAQFATGKSREYSAHLRRLVHLLAAMSLSSPALAQDDVEEPRYYDDEFYSELIHSDLPLYDFDWENFWPRNFYREDAFGCETRVSFGDWEFTPNPADEYADPRWFRITNYGVFHCGAIFRGSYERAELANQHFEYGFFALIGEVQHDDQTIELWVLQQGLRPGSDYTLLSRPQADGLVESFTVLQQRCPEDAMRELDRGLDIWRTGYCVINSPEDMLSLAVDMLNYPPSGTVERRGDSDWIPTEAPAPAIVEPAPEDSSSLLEAFEAEQR